jgi:hypothetical protein
LTETNVKGDGDKIRVCAIGVLPNVPYVYWDYDFEDNERNEPQAGMIILKGMAAVQEPKHYHYCIRRTKHGLHLVMQVDTWDNAQAALYELKKITNKISIMNCRKQRMRISPKWDMVTGEVRSPAPRVVDGCIHSNTWYQDITDRKISRLEFYTTFEHTISTREWKPQDLILPSTGERIA